jgi:hypothetical protein
LQEEIELALAPLQGLIVWGPARAADMLTLQVGGRQQGPQLWWRLILAA